MVLCRSHAPGGSDPLSHEPPPPPNAVSQNWAPLSRYHFLPPQCKSVHVSFSHQQVHVAISIVRGRILSAFGGGDIHSPMHGLQSRVIQTMGTLSTAAHSPVIPLGHCAKAQWWDHRTFPGVMVHPAPAVWLKGARDTGFGTGGHDTVCTVQP